MVRITTNAQTLYERALSYDELQDLLEYAEAIQIRRSIHTSVILRVCDRLGISPEILKTKDRHEEVVKARAIIYYRLVNICKYKLTTAGRLFNQTHATVIHAIDNLSMDDSWMTSYKLIFQD